MNCICGYAREAHVSDEHSIISSPFPPHHYQPDTINVLDKGFVRLVDAMPRQVTHGDLRVAEAARVGQDSDNPAERLIRYMMKNRHTSPFEHVVFTFHVKAPIFVFRQWHRHRTQSYNEESGRYSELHDEFYIPARDRLQRQADNNRQGSSSELVTYPDEVREIIQLANAAAYSKYEVLLHYGLSRELARTVLPVSIYSSMYTTVNLHNLLHFLSLRLDAHAQFEIREYADAIANLIAPFVPTAYDAWQKQR